MIHKSSKETRKRLKALIESEPKYRENTSIMLKRIRNSTGLKQCDFAAEIGMSCSTYATYERGERALPRNIQQRICLVFCMDPYPEDSIWAPRNMLLSKNTMPSKPRKILLAVKWLLAKKDRGRSLFRVYTHIQLSPLKRMLVKANANLVAAFTVTYCFALLFYGNDPVVREIGSFESNILLISFFGLVLTFPLDLVTMCRFHFWCKKTRA